MAIKPEVYPFKSFQEVRSNKADIKINGESKKCKGNFWEKKEMKHHHIAHGLIILPMVQSYCPWFNHIAHGLNHIAHGLNHIAHGLNHGQ